MSLKVNTSNNVFNIYSAERKEGEEIRLLGAAGNLLHSGSFSFGKRVVYTSIQKVNQTQFSLGSGLGTIYCCSRAPPGGFGLANDELHSVHVFLCITFPR